jgi:hypothetical protein
MLITNKITDCNNCKDLSDVICEIDNYLANKGQVQLNKTKFNLFSSGINKDTYLDISRYKSIIYKRMLNPSYLYIFPTPIIIGQVKQLMYK